MKLFPYPHTLLTLFVALGLACVPLIASADAAQSVSVVDPYVRAVAPGQQSSAAFMRLRNDGDAGHALVSADSAAARIVELHTHVKVDGMMSMRQIERIDIPSGEETVLEPGGLHVMLIDLTRQLEAGDDVSITLVFQDGSEKAIRAPVRKIRTKMHHHH